MPKFSNMNYMALELLMYFVVGKFWNGSLSSPFSCFEDEFFAASARVVVVSVVSTDADLYVICCEEKNGEFR